MLARSKYGTSRWVSTRGGARRPRRPGSSAEPARRVGRLAIAGPRGAARAQGRLRCGWPTSMRSMSGASRATAWPSVRRGHHGERLAAGPARAWTGCAGARARPAPAAMPCADSTAVLAPSSCASLTVCRMPSRRPPSRRCSAGVSTYTACQVTASCRASCAALRTTCSAPSCGPMQHSSAPSVFHTCAIDAVDAVGLHVVFHAVGRAAQRQLAQGHQVALAEEVLRRPLGLRRQVDLAGRQPLDQLVGRRVHQHHFVGTVEEGVGQRLVHHDAGDATDHVVEALQVLDIERAVDVDAGRQQFLDVLPALRVARARRRWSAPVRRPGSGRACAPARRRGRIRPGALPR